MPHLVLSRRLSVHAGLFLFFSICVQVWVASSSSPPFPSVCDSIVRLLSLFSVFPRPPPLLLLLLLLVSSCHVPLLSPSLHALILTPLFLPLISEGDQANHEDGERNIADSLSPPSKKKTALICHGTVAPRNEERMPNFASLPPSLFV